MHMSVSTEPDKFLKNLILMIKTNNRIGIERIYLIRNKIAATLNLSTSPHFKTIVKSDKTHNLEA